MADDNQERISGALMGVVEPGSSWIVRGIANDVLVEPFDVTNDPKAKFSSDLVARVDALNERLSNSGTDLGLWMMLATGLACVGIHLNWFESLLGIANPYVQSILFYAAAMIIVFFAMGFLSQLGEQRLYRRFRQSLLDQIKRDGLQVADVYVQIKDDDELDSLAKHLRQDPVFLDDASPF